MSRQSPRVARAQLRPFTASRTRSPDPEVVAAARALDESIERALVQTGCLRLESRADPPPARFKPRAVDPLDELLRDDFFVVQQSYCA